MNSSIVLLSSTKEKFNFVGEPVRGEGLYSCKSGGIHTLAIYLSNFSGKLIFEAALTVEPHEDDWFPVKTMIFPDEEYVAHGSLKGYTGTIGETLIGNFTWLRARIDRKHLLDPPPENPLAVIPYGYIDQILLKY